MEIIIIIGVIVITMIVFLNALVIVPEYTFYVWSVLRSRVRGPKGILREGPHIVCPFISSTEKVSLELVKKDIKFSFTTKDGFNMSVEGVFQYRPDPDVLHLKGHPDEGRNVFVTVSEEVILAGVIEAVEARIGGIGGNHPHTVFIESRPALGDIINAILRLARPPHIMHKKSADVPNIKNTNSWGEKDWYFCGNPSCPFDKPINANQLIEFYNFHWPEIRVIKANEKELYDSHSDIEQRYGIDVETFDLGNVNFTSETQAALEEEKQAEARAKAANKRIELAKKFRTEVEVSPQTAVDQADLLLDPAIKKNIVSIQGEAGILGGIISAFTKKGGE